MDLFFYFFKTKVHGENTDPLNIFFLHFEFFPTRHINVWGIHKLLHQFCFDQLCEDIGNQKQYSISSLALGPFC